MKLLPRSVVLLAILGCPTLAQVQQTDWLTSALLGSLWRSESTIPLGDTSYVEPFLRPLLPTTLLVDLRFARYPGGAQIAESLAAYAGLLGPGHGRAAQAITTDSMLGIVSEGPHHTVDQSTYIRLRLFDHLIGDWSRTPDDIRWLSEGTQGDTLWKPVPMAYENAFTKYDGLVPWLLLQTADHMSSWSGDVQPPKLSSSPMAVLDRRVLSSAAWPVWEAAAADLEHHLTPAACERAVSSVPTVHGDVLLAALENRLRHLADMAQQYYRESTRFVEFYSAGLSDSILVRVLSSRAVEISTIGNPISSRLLNSLATQEVRLLLEGTESTVWIEGPRGLSFRIIADLPGGTTSMWHRRGSAYRWEQGTTGDVSVFSSDLQSLSSAPDDAWGERVVFVPWLDANKDDHVFLGGGPEITTSAYRAFPYATRTTVLAGFATRTRRYRLQGSFESRTIVRGAGIGVFAEYSQLNISNFFGMGNETAPLSPTRPGTYLKADQRMFELRAITRAYLSDALSVGFTPLLRILRTDPRPGSLIDSLISAGYARRLNYAGVRLDAVYDSRDRSAIPTKGMFASGEAAWYPAGLQNRSPFATIGFDSRYYWFIGTRGTHTLFRASGKAVVGDHPWFESAFLGGSQTLRGFERQRFAGDAAVSASLEMRVPLGRLQLLWPFDIGSHGFLESGRVFVDGESSRRWHSSLGAGIWVHPVRSPYTLVLSVAASPELTEFLATFGVPVRQ